MHCAKVPVFKRFANSCSRVHVTIAAACGASQPKHVAVLSRASLAYTSSLAAAVLHIHILIKNFVLDELEFESSLGCRREKLASMQPRATCTLCIASGCSLFAAPMLLLHRYEGTGHSD